MLDFLLTYAHHLAVFSLVGVLVVELVLVRPGLDARTLPMLARIDMAYGSLAGLVIAVGILRVLFGAAGWEPYVGNLFFWLKMAAFAATGLISVVPTRAIIAWRRAAEGDPAYQPPLDEVRGARNYVVLGAAVLALVPGFAAAITRL